MAKVLVAVRLDSNMVQSIDLRGSRSKVIRAALEMYLGSGIVQLAERSTHTAHVAGSSPAPATKVQAQTCCPKNREHRGFHRSDGFWCMDCATLY